MPMGNYGNPYLRANPVETGLRTWAALQSIDQNRDEAKQRVEDRRIRAQELERTHRNEDQDRIDAAAERKVRMHGYELQQSAAETAATTGAEDRAYTLATRTPADQAVAQAAEDRTRGIKKENLAMDVSRANIAESQSKTRLEQKKAAQDDAQRIVDFYRDVPDNQLTDQDLTTLNGALKTATSVSLTDALDPKYQEAADQLVKLGGAGKLTSPEARPYIDALATHRLNESGPQTLDKPITRHTFDGKEITLPAGTVIGHKSLADVGPSRSGDGYHLLLRVQAKTPDGKDVEYGAFRTKNGIVEDPEDVYEMSADEIQRSLGGRIALANFVRDPAIRQRITAAAAANDRRTNPKGSVAGDTVRMDKNTVYDKTQRKFVTNPNVQAAGASENQILAEAGKIKAGGDSRSMAEIVKEVRESMKPSAPPAPPPAPAQETSSAAPDPSQFDTKLSPDQEIEFQKWKKEHAPNDTGIDYDNRGAFLAKIKTDARGHGPDDFKKPNHPTFSDESIYNDPKNPGGKWVNKDGKDYFYASPANLKYHTAEELKAYFKRVEPDVQLVLPEGKIPPPPKVEDGYTAPTWDPSRKVYVTTKGGKTFAVVP